LPAPAGKTFMELYRARKPGPTRQPGKVS
jgi:hypothetical protein